MARFFSIRKTSDSARKIDTISIVSLLFYPDQKNSKTTIKTTNRSFNLVRRFFPSFIKLNVHAAVNGKTIGFVCYEKKTAYYEQFHAR